MVIMKFTGPKSLEVIQQQCEEHGLIMRRNAKDSFMRDFVVVSWPENPNVSVYVNLASGWFFGANEAGEPFDSRSPNCGAGWYEAMQEFFLVPTDDLSEVVV